MKKEKKKEYQRYYLAYSAAVTGLFCVILLIFQKNGKSFIRGGDGLGQHYVALEYWGKYLRRIVKGILLEHRLNIPQWDLHIGYGADILTTLHYYVIGDPLNLLAVFVPAAYMEFCASSGIIWRESHFPCTVSIIRTENFRYCWVA